MTTACGYWVLNWIAVTFTTAEIYILLVHRSKPGLQWWLELIYSVIAHGGIAQEHGVVVRLQPLFPPSTLSSLGPSYDAKYWSTHYLPLFM